MQHSARTLIIAGLLFLFSLATPLSVLAASLTVTAVVPANATSFSANLASDLTETKVGQGKDITYTLTYGSTLSTTTDVTLEASWSRGTIQGNASPSVDVLSYVSGSATNGYNGAAPVIDLVNQKITWTISLPQTANQKVSFTLRSSSTLTSSLPISFTVTGHLVGPGFTTEDSSLTNNFLVSKPEPTATPTPGPTATPTPAPTDIPISPLPTLAPQSPTQALKITSVDVHEISSDSVSIGMEFNLPRGAQIKYGTDFYNLTNTVVDTSITTNHTVQLENLEPGTTYYFQAVAIRRNGGLLTSDIFTVTTAQTGDIPTPIVSSLIVTSNNIILTNPAQSTNTNEATNLTIPTSSLYEFKIAIPNSGGLSRVKAILRNTVLGISFPFFKKAEAVEDTSVDLVEVSPGIFAGKLVTPKQIGNYDLIVKIYAKTGSISERKVANVKVSSRFTLRDAITKAHIEDARVVLYTWDVRTKQYKLIHPESSSIPNPIFSDTDGTLPLVLPSGKYKAEIYHLKYLPKTIEFTINGGTGYPTVELTSTGLNIINVSRYLMSGLVDVFYTTTYAYFQTLASSHRVLELAYSLSILIFILLFILALKSRLQLPIMRLPHFLVILFYHAYGNAPSTETITGKIIDSATDQPLKGALVYLFDQSTGILKDHTLTNGQGQYHVKGIPTKRYRIEVLKVGYHANSTTRVFDALDNFIIALSPKVRGFGILAEVTHTLDLLLAVSIVVILFLLLVLVLIDVIAYPSPLSMLFAFIAIANLRVFLLYRQYHRQR